MKSIIKLLLLVFVLGCSSDDNHKKVDFKTCKILDLGITEENKNPYPDAPNGYNNWKWNKINDTILRIKVIEQYYGQTVFNYEYYYFLIDKENECISFQIAKFRGGSDVDIQDNPQNGVVNFDDSSDYSFELQKWSENEIFIGRLIPNNSNYPEADQKLFWVELNSENYEPQTDWEDYLGL